jgi:hypothetical protein
MIIPLGLRQERLQIKNLVTRDLIPIEELNLLVFHRLMKKEDLEASQKDAEEAPKGAQREEANKEKAAEEAEFQDKLLLDPMWNPLGADWDGALVSITSSSTRHVIGCYELGQIWPLSGDMWRALRNELMDNINRETHRFGVHVTQVDFGEIALSEEATRALLERKVAQWQVEIASSQREQQHDVEGLRGQLQRAMIAEIGDKLKDAEPEQITTLQTMRLIEALEKLADNPGGNAVLLTELLRLLEQANLSAPRPGSTGGTPQPPAAANT